ncbi:MAG: hypothetical protein AB7I18_12690 [Candidatus Berkiella sp.]
MINHGFSEPNLPKIQENYSLAERDKFHRIIEQIQHHEDHVASSQVIANELPTDSEKQRFFSYCADTRKIQEFRQACLNCHKALTEHANYLQENLQANRQPEGPQTAKMLQGIRERRDSLLGMYARHIVSDIAATVKSNPTSPRSSQDKEAKKSTSPRAN